MNAANRLSIPGQGDGATPGGPLRLAAVLLVCSLAPACFTEEAPEPALIRPVLVHPVELVSATRVRTFPSRARAGAESVLSFRVGGVINALHVSVGDAISAGSPIAELEASDLVLELRRAEAQLAEASARDRNARSRFGRTKRLHQSKAASANDLDAARTDATSARANLDAQTQAVGLAKSRFGYATLSAPADGTIASVPVELNENVESGDPIVTLNSGGRPEVTFSVPGRLIGSIERGMLATVHFTALPDEVFPAEVVEVGVSSGRTAFPVTARLVATDPRIRSGLVAETTLRFERKDIDGKNNVVVPAFAVAEDAQGRFVFVAIPQPASGGTPDGLATIERQEVETASLTVDGLEITKGLAVGDLVVTAGQRFVEPGMSVRLTER
jgi:RND family efflux transporter MFP subunit